LQLAVGSGILRIPSTTSSHLQANGAKEAAAVLSTGDRASTPPPAPEKLKKILTGEELKKEGGKPVKGTTRTKDEGEMERKHVKIASTQKDKYEVRPS